MHHETDGDEVIFQMIQERTTAGLETQRPAEGVLHEALLVLLRLDLPELLDADAEFLRLAIFGQVESGNQLFGERSAHALADQHVFAVQFHAAGEVRARLAILLDAHIAGGNADDSAVVVIKHFRGGKARIDLDAEPFRLFRQPATDEAKRDDVIAMIVHQWRHHGVRQADGARRPQEQELVVLDLGLEGMPLLVAPSRQQPVDADGVDHGAGEDVGTDFRALFQHDDRELRLHLLQSDCGGKTGRTRTDDHNVEFHRFAFGQFHRFRHFHPLRSPVPSGCCYRLFHTCDAPPAPDKKSIRDTVSISIRLCKAARLCRASIAAKHVARQSIVRQPDDCLLLLRSRNNEDMIDGGMRQGLRALGRHSQPIIRRPKAIDGRADRMTREIGTASASIWPVSDAAVLS